jgi:hypothetical protein
VENYGIYSGWDTGMHAWVTVSPSAPTQMITVTVTSNGYWGQPFLPQYPNQPNYGSATATLLQVAPSCGFSIPASGLRHTLSDDYLTTSVPLRVVSNCSGSASWSIIFSYETSGGKGSWGAGRYYLRGPLNQPVTLNVPDGVGGRADATVTISVPGQPPPPPLSAVFYVAGRTIPDSVITDRLLSLYAGGATPRLFTGVAAVECSYRQFSPSTLYGQSAYWPLESPGGGSYVGLIMVPAGMEHAYSFLFNTAFGVDLFMGDKMTFCRNDISLIRSTHPMLRDLTAQEYEKCALVKYGPYPTQGLYYAPNESGTDWVVDADPSHQQALEYVDSVFRSIR